MIEIVNETSIRVHSGVNLWMDCTFKVVPEDVERAAKVLDRAWDLYWDEAESGQECYGDWLEKRLKEAGIRYSLTSKK